MADGTAARLAVLTDADNASPAAAPGLLAEVARYGTAHARRAYGDWTGTRLAGWKEHLLSLSIWPVQQAAGVRVGCPLIAPAAAGKAAPGMPRGRGGGSSRPASVPRPLPSGRAGGW